MLLNPFHPRVQEFFGKISSPQGRGGVQRKASSVLAGRAGHGIGGCSLTPHWWSWGWAKAVEIHSQRRSGRRGKGRGDFHPLVCSLNGSISRGWTRQKPGIRRCPQVPQVCGKDPCPRAISHCFLRYVTSSGTCTLLHGMLTPSVLATRLDAHPKLAFYPFVLKFTYRKGGETQAEQWDISDLC